MSNLTSVGVTSGQGSSGTGTVSTIDALMADGGQATLGTKADAKNSATDTTSISIMSVLKQVSSSIQAAATSLANLVNGTVTAAVGVALSITRTANTTAYSAGQVIGTGTSSGNAALSFASMRQAAGDLLITSVALEIDSAGLISGESAYNLYLYNVTPPSALADGGAFDLPSGDRAAFLGVIPLGTPAVQGTNTCYVETNGINKQVTLSGTGLFGYLQTVGAYTPTSARVYKVTLHGIPV